jgi:hypothetical protein
MKAMEGSPFAIFSWIPRGNVDSLEIDFLLYKMEKNVDPANDLEFIKLAPKISEVYENNYNTTPEHWVYHAKEISDGKYPIQFLPLHVQKLANQLYYS